MNRPAAEEHRGEQWPRGARHIKCGTHQQSGLAAAIRGALGALERATAHLMGCLGKAPQSIRWQIATGSRGDHFCVVLSKALA